MRLLAFLAVFVFPALSYPAVPTEYGFYLHEGDTVVFYGDSITNQRMYTDFAEAYVLTRFPKLRIRFVHSGFPGDRVSGGTGGTIDERLRHDVFAYHPSVVTVMLGMNDGEYRAYDPAIFAKFASGYRHLIQELKTELPGSRITLLETSPYDDVTRPPQFPGGYNAVLIRFGSFVASLAREEQFTLADLNTPAVAVLRNAHKESPKAALDLIPDRVHPSAGIHLILAEALLKAWHAPSLVTAVEIDAPAGTVRRADNTAVEALRAKDEISWTQRDNALPMPLDPPDEMIPLAIRVSDFTSALNQELLKVSGLKEGTYRLRIDDAVTGSFSARQLALGINLAAMATPMSAQAQKVLDLTHRHNNLHFARWRTVEGSLQPYPLTTVQPVMDSLSALEEEVVALQRATALPEIHRYRLTKT